MSLRQAATLAGTVAAGVAAGVLAGRFAEHGLVRGQRRRPDPLALELASPPPGGRSRVVVTDDGVALHVEEAGDPEAALTVVFSHGWTLSQACWFYQRRDLPGPGVRCVFYDQRGHGASGRPDLDTCTIETFASDLARVLQVCAPRGPVVLVGHSMGGMTVLGLAAAQPELFGPSGRVVGVALLSTSAGRLAEVTFGLPAAAGRLAQRLLPGAFAQLARGGDRWERYRLSRTDLSHALTRRLSFGGDIPPSLVDLMETMIGQVPLAVAAACAQELVRHDKLAALPVLAHTPALVMVGEADVLTPPEHSRAIAEELPEAELVVLPGAGHMIQLERPGLVNLHLRTLLARASQHHQPA